MTEPRPTSVATRVAHGRALAVEGVSRALGLARPALLGWEERRARAQGLSRPCFVLTFDCDTDADLDVVESVHDRLARVGITPAYAVPGQLLEAGAAVYGRIAAGGAELLNHGYQRHCELVRGAYVSSFFYDELSWDVVEADIRKGHDAHLQISGRRPVGFRAPHFGTVGRARRDAVHRLLGSMGYRYSSSTMPMRQLLGGPVQEVAGGLVELPVSGRPSAPARVLDSWSFRFAPNRVVGEADYERDLTRAVEELLAGRCRVVNVYADPSQVADWPPFFELVGRAAPVALPSLVGLLDVVGR